MVAVAATVVPVEVRPLLEALQDLLDLAPTETLLLPLQATLLVTTCLLSTELLLLQVASTDLLLLFLATDRVVPILISTDLDLLRGTVTLPIHLQVDLTLLYLL